MALEIRGLRVSYNIEGRGIEVVRGLDLDINKGECVGLVGESGCGKSTVGLAITRLIPERKGSITAGNILLGDKDVLTLGPDGLRDVRRSKVSYVFQDPFSSLNPVFTVYDQLKEALPDKRNADEIISGTLESVGLSGIIGNKKIYPHELSGGMQQRVMIAMAIMPNPGLLILDEPTTALDVTVQNQILDLVARLKDEMKLSVLFISHDLRTVFRISDRVFVMYAGKIVEKGLKQNISLKPGHPYTVGLMDSMPSFERRKQKFNAIEGRAPLFSELPKGCKFYPRCKFRVDDCALREPGMEIVSGEDHVSRCIRIKEIALDGISKS
ncbi:MAG: ABC transporter ATP-binding protein [Candidatus Omnitrophica bacterium]|nr:ABC transporter ATP-binding protein [Candidatus Omnitrophota bacterium]